ncbi:MFS transporter, OFA family, oxalate/formate antiporter [Terrisporobacter glycolicus]|nr:MFS transporter, OFA family, oxalate/formate antiporter [Terrisporobacter glycolicus]
MKTRRWIYGAIGVVVLLFAGLVYAWSVLAMPIREFFTDWSSTKLSFTFTLCMMFFCFGGLITGLLSEKVSPKIMLKLSAILFLVGFFIASHANNIITLYMGYGVLAGLASGFAYNSIMGNVMKFFPDCPGLISGVLLMGFGFGSFLIGKVYQAVTPYGPGIDKWRNSFLVFGVILFAIMFVCSFFIRKPTKEELVEINKDIKNKNLKNKSNQLDLSPAKMLKKPSFWIFFTWAASLSASGLAIVSQASGVAIEVGKDISPGTISTVVGMISIFNGIGRVIFGGLYDRIGRLKTMLLNDTLFLLASFILIIAIKSGQFSLIIIGFVLIGLSYGGITPTNSAFVNDFYGSKNYAVNLSLVNMNLLIASFGSTIAGLLYDSSGSYYSTLMVMIIAILCSFIFTLMITKVNNTENKVLEEINNIC